VPADIRRIGNGGINIEYPKGAIRSIGSGRNDIATQVVQFTKSLFVSMDRSSAEQLRRGFSTTMKIVSMSDAQQGSIFRKRFTLLLWCCMRDDFMG
jgi:hypothetical protein